MVKRKIVREEWSIEVPIVAAMGSVCFQGYAVDTALVFDAIRSIPDTRSFDGSVLITTKDEDQADRIMWACEQAEKLITHE
jgi:hypothetical protein